jgi:hypothetical protein
MSNKSNDLKKAMIEALSASLGIVTHACKTVNIARKTHYEWYKEDEAYRKQVDEVNEIALDFAESKLFQNIKDGKEASIFYYLNNKGASRGYFRVPQNEKPDDDKPTTINITFPDNFKPLPSSESEIEAERKPKK